MALALQVLFALTGLGWLTLTIFVRRAAAALRDLEGLDVPPRGRVRIVIAVRNGADCIASTVAGVLAQRSLDFELVVVDDRSDDDTSTIVTDLVGGG